MSTSRAVFLTLTKYNDSINRVISKYAKDRVIIYVTANKTFKYIHDLIEAKEVFYIDCISKNIGGMPLHEADNCMYLSSPQQLTKLSLLLKRVIKILPGEKVVVFDSIGSLLIYNKPKIMTRFMNSTINSLKNNDVDSIMLITDKKELEIIGSMVDEIVKK